MLALLHIRIANASRSNKWLHVHPGSAMQDLDIYTKLFVMLFAEMVHRWNSGVLYRRSCYISKFRHISTDSVCSPDCHSDNNCVEESRGMYILSLFYVKSIL